MAIANADGSIVLTTKVDQSGLKKGMSTMKGGVSSLVSSFGKLGAAIGVAFSVGALIKFSKEASNLATTTEASVQRLIDIYGEASKAVGDFIDANAQALGMSRTAAASYASVYGNLFSVWADQATNAQLTNAYLNMTAVVASKTGRTVEDVQERIRSGLLGNTEAIEDLGVFVNVKTIEMTDAFQRMADGKSWEQLDAYTQQQIRTMAILEQATSKYGDEVAQTSALAKSQLQAAWQDFQATWGTIINRVLVPALEVLTSILIVSTKVMQYLAGISGETIKQGEAIDNATEKQKEFREEIEKTNDSAKKSLSTFDEIKTLSGGGTEDNSASGADKSVGVGIGINISGAEEVDSVAQEMEGVFDTVKAKAVQMGEEIQKALEPLTKISFKNLGESLSNLVQPLKELGLFAWDILKDAIEKVIAPLAEFVIEDVLPIFFDTLGTAIDGFQVVLNKSWDIILKFIDEFLTPIWEYAEPKILEVLNNLNTKLKDFVKLVEESEAWADFQTIMSAIYTVLEPVVKAIIDFLAPIIKFKMNSQFIDLKFVFKSIEDIIGAIAALINGDFDDAWQHLKKLFVSNFVDAGKEKFQAFSDVIEGITGFNLAQWVKDAWENVKKFWTKHIAPIFTKKWWKDLGKTCMNGIIEGLEGGINGIIGAFEKMINWIVKGLNKISFNIPNWVPGIGGKTFGFNISEVKFSRVSIPRLAQGAVIPPNKEFLAVLGDQKQGTNIEAPLQTIVDAFNVALDGRGAGEPIQVHMYLDGKEVYDVIVNQNKKNTRITGVNALAY